MTTPWNVSEVCFVFFCAYNSHIIEAGISEWGVMDAQEIRPTTYRTEADDEAEAEAAAAEEAAEDANYTPFNF
jgi:hypothetical protein